MTRTRPYRKGTDDFSAKLLTVVTRYGVDDVHGHLEYCTVASSPHYVKDKWSYWNGFKEGLLA